MTTHQTVSELQAKAVAFQDEVFQRSGRLPSLKQIAADLGTARTTLARLPQFVAARRAIEGITGRLRGGKPLGSIDEAIAYQDQVFQRCDELVTLTELEKSIRISRKTLLCSSRFVAARRAIEANGHHSKRGRPWPTEKENKAIAYQDEVLKQWGRLVTLKEIAAHIEVSHSLPPHWPRLMTARREIERKVGRLVGGCCYLAKEDKAIAFQNEVFRLSERVPTFYEVAGHVHVHRQTPSRWPRFMAIRQGLEKKIGAKVGQSNRRGHHAAGKEGKAIAYQDEFFQRSGRVPTYKELGAHVHCWESTLFHFPHFMPARRGLQAKGAPSNRGGHRPTGKEDKAIAYQEEIFRRSGRLPTCTEVTAHTGYSQTSLYRSSRFKVARREIAKKLELVAKTTPWGKPRDFREGEAISRLQETFDSTGRVPPVAELADSLGVGKRVFNAWPVFRLAYRSLWSQQRPEGETAAGNGKALQADKADTKADTHEKKLPDSVDVRDLCRQLQKERPKGRSAIDIAREFTGKADAKAKNLLRQARRYKHLWT